MLLKVIGTGSKGNSYVLESENEALILDAGCRMKDVLKAIDYNVSKICGVLITHEHGDHAKYIQQYLDCGISVYMPKSVYERFEISTFARKIHYNEFYYIGHFGISPFSLPHDGTENYGFCIYHLENGKFIYMTDLEYPTMSFRKTKIEHLLCEVNYCEELAEREEAQYTHRLRGHLSLNTFIEKVLKVNMTPALRTVTLCHLSDTAADEQMILERVKEVVGDRVTVNIAKPGLQVEINKYPF